MSAPHIFVANPPAIPLYAHGLDLPGLMGTPHDTASIYSARSVSEVLDASLRKKPDQRVEIGEVPGNEYLDASHQKMAVILRLQTYLRTLHEAKMYFLKRLHSGSSGARLIYLNWFAPFDLHARIAIENMTPAILPEAL
ncbi:hypothetical protein [Roseovarius sp. M141]|uniref:hypothetical protein n=1 Tax=Roseovarius sp. M141 TaxID=2583806 RepID=UPI0020CD190A|nr:hypothetical protein [Roseovarius sp. M141]MCQ0092932.1 hypothetical protein [Roseovarius sp. M141]